MASPSPQKETFHSVYGVGEDLTGPSERRACYRLPFSIIRMLEQEGEIERIDIATYRRSGCLKVQRIFRFTPAAYLSKFAFRGLSCSAGPQYVADLAAGLADDKWWAKKTIAFFKFRQPVTKLVSAAL